MGLAKEVRGGVAVVGGGVPTEETKPDTGYLKAEMGGACMPNGDTDQRLISLGAHFNLTTQNTHSPLSTRSHSPRKGGGEEKITVLKQITRQTLTIWLLRAECRSHTCAHMGAHELLSISD